MQFDLAPPATTVTTKIVGANNVSTEITTKIAGNATLPSSGTKLNMAVSAQWLSSVFGTLLVDVLASGPIAIVFGILVAAVVAKFAAPAELEVRAV